MHFPVKFSLQRAFFTGCINSDENRRRPTSALRCVAGRDVHGVVTAASAVLSLAGSADHHQQLLHPLRSSCHAPGHALVSFGSHQQHRGFGWRCSLVPRSAAVARALQMWCQTTRSSPGTPWLGVPLWLPAACTFRGIQDFL